MAILKIARMGHPVLKRVAEPISDPTSAEVRRLVSDMLDTLEDADGTGLAAPQVHVPRRIVMFYVAGTRARRAAAADEPAKAQGPSGTAPPTSMEGKDEGEDEDEPEVPLTVLINPLVEPLSDETAVGWESCLSVPGLAGQVPRHRAVRYRGLNLRGEEIVREARGFHARVVQHECDHLDGVLYPQRMSDLSTLAFTSEMAARTGAPVREE